MPPILINTSSKQKYAKGTAKKLWSYFAKYKWQIIVSFTVSTIAGAFTAIAIYMYALLYSYLMKFMGMPDTALINTISGFVFAGIGLLFIYILSNLFTWLTSFLTVKIAERGCYHLRTAIFRKLHKIPIKYFDQTPSGDIISRTANDVDNITRFISQYVGNSIYWICSIISVGLLMFLANWALSLIVLLIYPLVALINMFIIKTLRPYYAKQQKCLGELNGYIEEYISGTKIISLFKMEDEVKKNFDILNEKLTKNSTIANSVTNVMMPLNGFFNNMSFVILAAWGVVFILNGWIKTSWGVLNILDPTVFLVMFTMIARNLTNPINQLISTFGQMMLCLASSDRVFQILEQDEEKDPANAKILTQNSIQGVVEAKNMDFAYTKDKPILKNINFIAKPETVTALVGPTGAGKTTIVNLITKFYDINGGKLMVDGTPIANINRTSLRQNITMVLQDTYLFGVSIYENIRYGKLNATKKEIIQAAKLANCHDFITKLSNGYDTILSDNGGNLSQGQRQLIAIARAFLADSKIVILDEATSSIDTKTEIQIQEAMEKLIKNRTTLMIAHRLSTIKNADNILVIDGGKIVEQGKHKDLIAKKGFYYKLYMSQFRGNQI